MSIITDTDASEAFELAHHSEHAREMMKQYCVGVYVDVSQRRIYYRGLSLKRKKKINKKRLLIRRIVLIKI